MRIDDEQLTRPGQPFHFPCRTSIGLSLRSNENHLIKISHEHNSKIIIPPQCIKSEGMRKRNGK